MAYDYRQQGSSRAGPSAPIIGELNEHSISESVESLSGRVPNNKLILGLPFMDLSGRRIPKLTRALLFLEVEH